jgi:hypothetical protein
MPKYQIVKIIPLTSLVNYTIKIDITKIDQDAWDRINPE